MRVLLPGPADEVDVHAFYAAEWIENGGMRVNFIASTDGAATAAGKSAGLQTPGDNLIFAALRDLADVVLAGAGTVATEGYRAITIPEPRRSIRRAYGLRDVLPTAVISRTLRLDPSASLFVDAVPEARTIVLTCAAAPAEQRAALGRVADLVICGDEAVEPARVRAALEERGLVRMLSEGGPTAFADAVPAGVVDEFCLSLSPVLVGPGPPRVTSGPPWPRPAGLSLTGLLEEDGALFLRYRVVRSGVGPPA